MAGDPKKLIKNLLEAGEFEAPDSTVNQIAQEWGNDYKGLVKSLLEAGEFEYGDQEVNALLSDFGLAGSPTPYAPNAVPVDLTFGLAPGLVTPLGSQTKPPKQEPKKGPVVPPGVATTGPTINWGASTVTNINPVTGKQEPPKKKKAEVQTTAVVEPPKAEIPPGAAAIGQVIDWDAATVTGPTTGPTTGGPTIGLPRQTGEEIFADPLRLAEANDIKIKEAERVKKQIGEDRFNIYRDPSFKQVNKTIVTPEKGIYVKPDPFAPIESEEDLVTWSLNNELKPIEGSERDIENKALLDQYEKSNNDILEATSQNIGLFLNDPEWRPKYEDLVGRANDISDKAEALHEKIKQKGGGVSPLNTEGLGESIKELRLSKDKQDEIRERLGAKREEIKAFKEEAQSRAANFTTQEDLDAYKANVEAIFKKLIDEESLLVDEINAIYEQVKPHIEKVDSYERKSKEEASKFSNDPDVKLFNSYVSDLKKLYDEIDVYRSAPDFPKFAKTYEEAYKNKDVRKNLFRSEAEAKKEADALRLYVEKLQKIRDFDKKYKGRSEFDDVLDDVVNFLRPAGLPVGKLSSFKRTLQSAAIESFVKPILGGLAWVSDSVTDNPYPSRYLRYGDNFSVQKMSEIQTGIEGVIPSKYQGDFIEKNFVIKKGDPLTSIFPEGTVVLTRGEKNDIIGFRDKDGYKVESLLDSSTVQTIKNHINNNKDKVESDAGFFRGVLKTVPSALDFAILMAGAPGLARGLMASPLKLSRGAASAASTFGITMAQQIGRSHEAYLKQGNDTDKAALFAFGETAAIAAVETFVSPIESKLISRGLGAEDLAKFRKIKDTTIADIATGRVGLMDGLGNLWRALKEFSKPIIQENFEEFVQQDIEDFLRYVSAGEKIDTTIEDRLNTVFSTSLITLLPAAGAGVAGYRTANADLITTSLWNSAKNIESFEKDLKTFVDNKMMKEMDAKYYNAVVKYINEELQSYDGLTKEQEVGMSGLIATRFNLELKSSQVENQNARKRYKDQIEEINKRIEDVVSNKTPVEVAPEVQDMVSDAEVVASPEDLANVQVDSQESLTQLEQDQARLQTLQSAISENNNAIANGIAPILTQEQAAEYENEITILNQKIKDQQDAIQEQSTAAVSVQPEPQTSEGVGGQVQPEPEVTTREGQEVEDQVQLTKEEIDAKKADIEIRRQEELDTTTSAGYGVIASDYLFTGGRGSMLSTDYLLQALTASFPFAGKQIDAIRNKYASKLGNISDDINSKSYNDAIKEIRDAINNTYSNKEIETLFDEILNNSTGFIAREGNRVSSRLEALNEEHQQKINAKYDAELADLEKAPQTTKKAGPTPTPTTPEKAAQKAAEAPKKANTVQGVELTKKDGTKAAPAEYRKNPNTGKWGRVNAKGGVTPVTSASQIKELEDALASQTKAAAETKKAEPTPTEVAETPIPKNKVRASFNIKDAGRLKTIQTTPAFKNIFSEEQLKNLKVGENTVDLNMTAWGKAQRMLDAKDVTKEAGVEKTEQKAETKPETTTTKPAQKAQVAEPAPAKKTPEKPKPAEEKPKEEVESKSLQQEADDLLNDLKASFGISSSNKSQIDQLEKKADSQTKRDTLLSVKRLGRVLNAIFPGMEIFVHESTTSYNEAVSRLNGRLNSGGNFSSLTDNSGKILGGRVDINLEVATPFTVSHEVAHAVLLKAFGDNQVLFNKFKTIISNILSAPANKNLKALNREGKLVSYEQALNDFISEYADSEKSEEYLVQLSAFLSVNQDRLKSNTTFEKIVKAVNNVIERITGGKFSPFKDYNSNDNIQNKLVVDFFNSIAGTLSGETGLAESQLTLAGNIATMLTAEPNTTLGSGLISSKNAVPVSKSSIDAIISGQKRTDKFNPQNATIEDLDGKEVIVTGSDRMTTAEYTTSDGKKFILMGGLFYPLETGKVWAAASLSKIKGLADLINDQVAKNGFAIVLLSNMGEDSHSSNYRFFQVAMAELSASLKNISLEDLKSRLDRFRLVDKFIFKNKPQGFIYTKDITSKKTGKVLKTLEKTKEEIVKDLLKDFTVENATFDARKAFINVFFGAPATKKRWNENLKNTYELLQETAEPASLGARQFSTSAFIKITGEVSFRGTSEKQDGDSFHSAYPFVAEPKQGTKVETFALDSIYNIEDIISEFTMASGEVVNLKEVSDATTMAGKMLGHSRTNPRLATVISPSRLTISSKASIIGKKGAKVLSKLDDFTIRLEDLKTAKIQYKLNNLDKKPDLDLKRSIKYATGWEKGADGKWRYEVLDPQLEMSVINNYLPNEEDIVYGVAKTYAILSIEDVLTNISKNGFLADVYEAYPELKDWYFEIASYEGDLDGRVQGFMSENDKIIGVTPYAKDIQSTFLHELQHFIQNREGFALGGNASLENLPYSSAEEKIVDKGIEALSEIINSGITLDAKFFEKLSIDTAKDYFKKIGIKQSNAALKNMVVHNGTVSPSAYIDFLISLASKKERVKPGSISAELLSEGKIPDELGEKTFYRGVKVKSLLDLLRLEVLRSTNRKGIDYYKLIAGEVEARNVQERAFMGHSARRMTLLEDTEDISREDQIIYFDIMDALEEEMEKGNIVFKDIFEPTSNKPSLNIKSKSSIIGQSGALALDRAERTTYRINKLREAEKMEAEGINKKAIRLSTGWERGADNLWRWEIDSSKYKITLDTDKPIEFNKNLNLEDVIDFPQLFEAYPKFRKMKVILSSKKGSYTGNASFDGKKIDLEIGRYEAKKITENKSLEDIYNKLPDEVRVILDKAVEIDSLKEKLLEKMGYGDEYWDAIKSLYPRDQQEVDDDILHKYGYAERVPHERFPSLILTNYSDDFYKLKRYRISLDPSNSLSYEKPLNLNEVFKTTLLHEIQHAVQKEEGFSRGGNLFLAYNFLTDTQRKEYEALSNEDKHTYLHNKYKSIAGEVEARNVESRINMSPEDRLQSLLEETEEVSKEDQIIISQDFKVLKDELVKAGANLSMSIAPGLAYKDVTVKRGPDFNTDLTWTVRHNDKEIGKLWYDNSLKSWINPDFDKKGVKPYTFAWIYGDVLGDTKIDAVNELIRRYNENKDEDKTDDSQRVFFTSDKILNKFLNTLNDIGGLKINPLSAGRDLLYNSSSLLTFNRFDKGNRNEINLESIHVVDKGAGIGKNAMKDITDAADLAGVTLTLEAKPFGVGGLDKKELVDFYKKNGFKVDLSKWEGEFNTEKELLDYALQYDSESVPMSREPGTPGITIKSKSSMANKIQFDARNPGVEGEEVFIKRKGQFIDFIKKRAALATANKPFNQNVFISEMSNSGILISKEDADLLFKRALTPPSLPRTSQRILETASIPENIKDAIVEQTKPKQSVTDEDLEVLADGFLEEADMAESDEEAVKIYEQTVNDIIDQLGPKFSRMLLGEGQLIYELRVLKKIAEALKNMGNMQGATDVLQIITNFGSISGRALREMGLNFSSDAIYIETLSRNSDANNQSILDSKVSATSSKTNREAINELSQATAQSMQENAAEIAANAAAKASKAKAKMDEKKAEQKTTTPTTTEKLRESAKAISQKANEKLNLFNDIMKQLRGLKFAYDPRQEASLLADASKAFLMYAYYKTSGSVIKARIMFLEMADLKKAHKDVDKYIAELSKDEFPAATKEIAKAKILEALQEDEKQQTKNPTPAQLIARRIKAFDRKNQRVKPTPKTLEQKINDLDLDITTLTELRDSIEAELLPLPEDKRAEVMSRVEDLLFELKSEKLKKRAAPWITKTQIRKDFKEGLKSLEETITDLITDWSKIDVYTKNIGEEFIKRTGMTAQEAKPFINIIQQEINKIVDTKIKSDIEKQVLQSYSGNRDDLTDRIKSKESEIEFLEGVVKNLEAKDKTQEEVGILRERRKRLSQAKKELNNLKSSLKKFDDISERAVKSGDFRRLVAAIKTNGLNSDTVLQEFAYTLGLDVLNRDDLDRINFMTQKIKNAMTAADEVAATKDLEKFVYSISNISALEQFHRIYESFLYGNMLSSPRTAEVAFFSGMFGLFRDFLGNLSTAIIKDILNVAPITYRDGFKVKGVEVIPKNTLLVFSAVLDTFGTNKVFDLRTLVDVLKGAEGITIQQSDIDKKGQDRLFASLNEIEKADALIKRIKENKNWAKRPQDLSKVSALEAFKFQQRMARLLVVGDYMARSAAIPYATRMITAEMAMESLPVGSSFLSIYRKSSALINRARAKELAEIRAAQMADAGLGFDKKRYERKIAVEALPEEVQQQIKDYADRLAWTGRIMGKSGQFSKGLNNLYTKGLGEPFGVSDGKRVRDEGTLESIRKLARMMFVTTVKMLTIPFPGVQFRGAQMIKNSLPLAGIIQKRMILDENGNYIPKGGFQLFSEYREYSSAGKVIDVVKATKWDFWNRAAASALPVIFSSFLFQAMFTFKFDDEEEDKKYNELGALDPRQLMMIYDQASEGKVSLDLDSREDWFITGDYDNDVKAVLESKGTQYEPFAIYKKDERGVFKKIPFLGSYKDAPYGVYLNGMAAVFERNLLAKQVKGSGKATRDPLTPGELFAIMSFGSVSFLGEFGLNGVSDNIKIVTALFEDNPEALSKVDYTFKRLQQNAVRQNIPQSAFASFWANIRGMYTGEGKRKGLDVVDGALANTYVMGDLVDTYDYDALGRRIPYQESPYPLLAGLERGIASVNNSAYSILNSTVFEQTITKADRIRTKEVDFATFIRKMSAQDVLKTEMTVVAMGDEEVRYFMGLEAANNKFRMLEDNYEYLNSLDRSDLAKRLKAVNTKGNEHAFCNYVLSVLETKSEAFNVKTEITVQDLRELISTIPQDGIGLISKHEATKKGVLKYNDDGTPVLKPAYYKKSKLIDFLYKNNIHIKEDGSIIFTRNYSEVYNNDVHEEYMLNSLMEEIFEEDME